MRLPEPLRQYRPGTLRGKLLLIALAVISVPIATAGYLLEREGHQALLLEKQERLFGLARILDSHLEGGFDPLLAERGASDRAAVIAGLNAALARFTDGVAAANPGVGVGFYSRAADAIVTYGPSREYADKVGLPIAPDHPGRRVMATGEPAVETGPQVRGQIMNAMWPIRRDGVVIGYAWANELADVIDRQSAAMDRAILAVSVLGALFGLLLIHLMSNRLSRDVKGVTDGLERMRADLGHRIAPPSGEIGEIAVAVNAMARALRDARSLTENILHSIADGVIAVDGQGRVTSINPAARRMVGLAGAGEDAGKGAEVIGRPYASLFKEGAAFASPLLDTLETGREHLAVLVDWPLPAQVLHVSVSSSLLRDSRGTPIGAVAVLKDLTEQRRLNKQIMRADRLAALGELMAGVAHEIRNPLTSIRGFMQFLETCDDIAEWRSYAPLIVRQVDSLNRIITELLEFGRSRPPFIRPVGLNELIREVTLLIGRKSNAQVILEPDPALPPVEADGEALKQVILNLVINAIQAIPESGTIRIATRASDGPGDGDAVVTVTDDGVGIPPEDLEKIFDPFYSTKPTGTGLGLAMVHRIVDAHHGTIVLTSTPGAGTTATLRLPFRHNTPVLP
ncbi:two-component system sensor histidine kinase AtoS [Azospirillum agricola]|uniref:two-component system sensor histidine kinase AtoS n=1 Tax=Azospirillum agricola TaxID=1720247 RepID=UPI001AE47325|nr:two-component system sensor histidine kinase AtoS [Azospirillum agricola]MBP2231541.1 two-component system sensor histidine kinase AtoS [Azospirillum agricola]